MPTEVLSMPSILSLLFQLAEVSLFFAAAGVLAVGAILFR